MTGFLVSSSKMLTDKLTNCSCRFGFVEMPGNKERLTTIDKLYVSSFQAPAMVANQVIARKETYFKKTIY
ncbi:MAG: hypothetical protein ACRDEB_00685 [Chitinophagaceae bacterium]